MDADEAYAAYKLDYNTGFEGDFFDWLCHEGLAYCSICDGYVAGVERVTFGALKDRDACPTCRAQHDPIPAC